MPTFDRVPLTEAKMKTASGKTAQILAEYVAYIEQLGADEAVSPLLETGWEKSRPVDQA